MNYISNFLAMRNATVGNTTMPMSSKSPHTIDCDVDATQLDKFNANSHGKSFTIASILGLKKKSTPTMSADESPDANPKELNAINLSIHNAQNFPPMPNKSSFNVIDAETRFLPNRLPLAFAHHHMQATAAHAQHHQTPQHFYPAISAVNNNNNNNNNNNLMSLNHNGASALQSLQQQFHAKNNQQFTSFHNKDQRNNKSGEFGHVFVIVLSN